MAKSDRKIRQIVMMMVEMILDGGGGVLSHAVCLLVTAERLKYLLSFNHLSFTFLFYLLSFFYLLSHHVVHSCVPCHIRETLSKEWEADALTHTNKNRYIVLLSFCVSACSKSLEFVICQTRCSGFVGGTLSQNFGNIL